MNRLVTPFSRSRFQSVSPAGPKKTRRMLLSTPTTSCPCRSKCSTASDPTRPLLPVTRTFIRSNLSLSPSAANQEKRNGIPANRIPEFAQIDDERAAPSLEEYQQSSAFLTAPSQDRPTIYDLPAISSGMPAAQRGTFGGCPQVVRHSLQEFETHVVLGRELADCISQRKKRTYRNDVYANGFQIVECSPHRRSSIDYIVHDRDAFTFHGRLQSFRQPVLDWK